jgi:hypothetical protein
MARRQNPIDFSLDPEATKIAREEYPRWRSITSLASPIKHRAITEDPRVVRSPHNFHVAVLPSFGGSVLRGAEPYGIEKLVASHIRPDAVTLLASPRNVGEIGQNLPAKQQDAESLYTAFTYLHRLGDELVGEGDPPNAWVVITEGTVSLRNFYDARGRRIHTALNPWQPPPAVVRAQDALGGLWRAFVLAVGGDLDSPGKVLFWKFEVLYLYVATHADSKMVREGYAGSSEQSIADLFALAELTTKPLVRPVDLAATQRLAERDRLGMYASFLTSLRYARETTGRSQEEIIDALNTYGVQFNILWRRWYNALIPALYGTGVLI